MIRALVLAFGQLTDPASRRVVWIAVLAAVASFAALFAGVEWALTTATVTSIGWLDTGLDVLGGLAVIGVAWLLFPAVVGMVAGFMLESVVERVEARHYPGLPAPTGTTLTDDILTALRFLLVLLAVNLAALPVYIFAPGLNLAVFYTVNGYLLGREYFDLVAQRRLGRQAAAVLRRSHPLKPFAAGVVIAFLSTMPGINLLVPVVATAFMVHVFHGLKSRSTV